MPALADRTIVFGGQPRRTARGIYRKYRANDREYFVMLSATS
ncbi:hypothetical protein OCAR_4616 [Afipia carboxidovorans OM5]|nr:hypothetical protein OCAR_4616 [Afipia carboxidovorans OM5]